MKTLLKPIGSLLFLILTFSTPAAAAYYDQNGVEVDKSQYDKIVKMRQANINKINTDGYSEDKTTLEDPVLLRKKRMEQWKAQQNQKKAAGRATGGPTGPGKK